MNKPLEDWQVSAIMSNDVRGLYQRCYCGDMVGYEDLDGGAKWLSFEACEDILNCCGRPSKTIEALRKHGYVS